MDPKQTSTPDLADTPPTGQSSPSVSDAQDALSGDDFTRSGGLISTPGISSSDTNVSATGRSIFANPQNRFRDTNPRGDVLISNSAPKKAPLKLNKKAAIIAVSIIAVIIIALISVMVISTISSNKKSNSGNTAKTIDDTDFTSYANFAITGNADATSLPPEDDLTTSAISTAIVDRDTEFMGTARDYFYGFYNVYNQIDKSSNTLLDMYVENYKEVFDFMYEYVNADAFNDETLLAYFLENGLEATEAEIDNRLSGISELDTEIGDTYASNKAAYDKAMVKAYDVYNNAECIVNGAIDDTCITTVTNVDTSTLADSLVNYTNASNTAFDEIITGCYKIYNEITEPTVYDEPNEEEE